MKNLITVITLSVSCLAFAKPNKAETLNKQANRLNRISNRLLNDVANLTSMGPGPQKRQLKREMKDKLQRLINVATRMDGNIKLPGHGGGHGPGHGGGHGPGHGGGHGPGHGGGYGPGHGGGYGPGHGGGYGYNSYSAECHIDDDSQLDFNQNVIGVLTGSTVKDIISECKQIAKATYGTFSSGGIKDVQFQGSVQPGQQSAECHIDDDSQLDYNQFVIGTIVGNDPLQIMNDCKSIAQAMYGTFSSAGITKLNAQSTPAYGMSVATCHIDDDSQFDYGQNIVGKVFGSSYIDMQNTCKALAQAVYGTFSSAGIQNVSGY